MKAARKSLLHPILVAGIVFAVLPFLLRWIGSTTTLGTEIAIYALYALGFNLLLGYTGLVSFGASAFFGAASYAAGIAVLHLFDNMYLSILFGTVTAGALGLVIGLLILRRRGIYFSLLTLAFTQLFYEIAFKWTDLTGGENGLQGISRSTLSLPSRLSLFRGWRRAVWHVRDLAHRPLAVRTRVAGASRQRTTRPMPGIRYQAIQADCIHHLRHGDGPCREPADLPDPERLCR